MVEHLPDQNRFVLKLPEGTAQLSYRLQSPEVMDILSTHVPSASRGRGNGAELVGAALAYAREHRMRVIPTCWYVGDYVAKHPEYNDLLI